MMKNRICRKKNFFRIATAAWLLLSAVNVDRLHAEDITWHRGAMGGAPETETVESGSMKLTDKNFTATNYVLIGWHTRKAPAIRNEAMENRIKTVPTFHAIGETVDIQTDQTFYAVWAIDLNNDGSPDYKKSIPGRLSPEMTKKVVAHLRSEKETESGNASLRSLPQWDINYDLLAYNDSVYYVGCTYNSDPENLVLEPFISFNSYKRHHCFGGYSDPIKARRDLELVFEYGGVLEDSCLIGGKDQKPLTRIPFPADGQTRVVQLIDSLPLTFTKIKEDGIGILKMYFVRAGTDELANATTDWDVSDPLHPWRNSPPPSKPWIGKFPKPFWSDEKESAVDTLTLKFRIYNQPKFESDVVSQSLDTAGRLRIKHLSGTPLKYMMRSINGWRWQPADSPLTDMEKEYVADNGSICLRQVDKSMGNQSFLKTFFLSPELFYPEDDDNGGIVGNFHEELIYNINKKTYEDIPDSDPIKTTIKNDYDSYLPESPIPGDMFALKNAFYFIIDSHTADSAKLVDVYHYPEKMNMLDYTLSLVKENWHVLAKRYADNVYVPEAPCRETFCLSFQKRIVPIINRAVFIPQVEGATISPTPGIHYIPSMKDFKFRVKYMSKPLKVTTDRIVKGSEEVLTGVLKESGEYEYVIPRVTQDINLKFTGDVSASSIENAAIWSYGHEIRIRATKEDVASIYSVTGQLVKRVVISGYTTIPMERGIYMVGLKDGSMHKVIVR